MLIFIDRVDRTIRTDFYVAPSETKSLSSYYEANILTRIPLWKSADIFNSVTVWLPWSQRLSFILYWQILRRESLLKFFFIGKKRWGPRKQSLWSRPLGTSLSCHQLLTVDSDWRTFLIALWVIWLDGLNIFGDGSGVYMFTFMGMGGELLLYQRILLPGKAKVFVVELAYNSVMLQASPIVIVDGFYLQEYFRSYFVISSSKPFRWHRATVWSTKWGFVWNSESRGRLRHLTDWPWKIDHIPVPSRSLPRIIFKKVSLSK